MALTVRVDESRSFTKTLVLEGRLDHESVADFDRQLDAVLGSPLKVLVFDLAGLEYVTSAGLRSIFRAHKAMTARAGKAVVLNPQPPVKKVLDIVKVADLATVFKNVRELDDYLDAMQRKVAEGGDPA
jgi:anti-anti-sigma factor